MTVKKNMWFLRFGIVTVAAVLLVIPTHAPAVEIHVPSEFATIQDAMDASQDGDIIVVQPGTYAENIDYKGKAVILTSTNPLDPTVVTATILDGNMNGSVITFNSGELAIFKKK